jgi:OOP family OmpA-OmpF porin
MKSKLLLSQLLGLLLLVLLILFVVPKYSKIIPNELEKKVESNLKKDGIKWVDVRCQDRDITISGIAPTIEEHNRAVSLAKDVKGVRRVYDKISPRVTSPYTMDISYDGAIIKLTGYMPSMSSKKLLLDKISNQYNYSYVDEIDIGTGEPKKWSEFITNIIDEIKNFDLVTLNIVGNEVYMSGKIETEKQKTAVMQSINKFKKDNYTISSKITAMDAAAKICQEKFNTLLTKQSIKFQSNKSIIKKSNQSLLENLSDIALLCPKVNIEIIGHTDSLGDDAKNEVLSLKRAKAVTSKLFGLGISLERMKAKGMGEKQPIADNESKDGRARNRRIEFKVLGD